MKLLLLSDIHGNREAFLSVLQHIASHHHVDAALVLGDVIDYGMHSNEIVRVLQKFPYRIVANIWGNHENAIAKDTYDRFSSERGRRCARYTREHLDENAWEYVQNEMTKEGILSFDLCGKKCLAVHGSLQDPFWGSIKMNLSDEAYRQYDFVFSGHSHIPHMFEVYYETEDTMRRNKKKTVFINPGSVGQPRNHNNRAQYAIMDVETEQVLFEKVFYNIEKEQKDYNDAVDVFYRDRLELGI